MPFRDAYKTIGTAIEQNDFRYTTTVNHTHEGSVNNLQNGEIKRLITFIVSQFNFSRTNIALKNLLQ